MTEKRFTDVCGCETGHIGFTDNGVDKLLTASEFGVFLNKLNDENKQLKQYKDAIMNWDSSKIIRVNKNTGEVDLVDKELIE